MKERYNKPAVFVASQLSSSIIALYKKKVDKKTIHRITKKNIDENLLLFALCVSAVSYNHSANDKNLRK